MYTEVKLEDQKNKGKMHPHKFVLWVAIGSIIMMFAGLTSAYIVKSGTASWQGVRTPSIFWYSTSVLLISSITMQSALRAFKQREMTWFRGLLFFTFVLGITFVVLQWIGFKYLWSHGVHFEGSGAGQFLYIIFGLHALHVLGGIITLLVLVIQHNFGKSIRYNATPIEVMTTYWHFVDILWIYLFIFFIMIG
jgi:cytochrome c oxidase subunit 3